MLYFQKCIYNVTGTLSFKALAKQAKVGIIQAEVGNNNVHNLECCFAKALLKIRTAQAQHFFKNNKQPELR